MHFLHTQKIELLEVVNRRFCTHKNTKFGDLLLDLNKKNFLRITIDILYRRYISFGRVSNKLASRKFDYIFAGSSHPLTVTEITYTQINSTV